MTRQRSASPDASEPSAHGTIAGLEARIRELEAQRASLTESADRLRTILELLPVGIWFTDAEGRIVLGNRAGQRIWAGARWVGVDQYGEYKGFRADTGERIAAEDWALARALRGQISLDETVDIECFDGTRKRILNSAVPVRDGQGAIVGAVVTNVDITERQQIAQSLDATNRRLRALLAAVPVGVSYSEDPTCERVSGNPTLQRQFELAPGDNASKSSPDPSSPGRRVRYYLGDRELGPGDLPLQRAVAEKREVGPLELEIELPSGRRWTAAASGAPVLDDRGEVLGGIAVTVDVTERRRAEALSEALGRIHLLVHSSRDLAHILRTALREATEALALETAAVSELDGRRWVVRHVHGLPDGAIGSTMEDDEERHALLAIRERRPVAIPDAWNDERVNRDHVRRWNVRSVLVVPLFVRDQPLGVCFFNAHAAPRPLGAAELDFGAKLGAALSLAIENARLFGELQESDRRKSEFIAVLSHELRNPLAPIRNAVALLEQAPPGGEPARRAREVLRRQTEHVARLVDDLLDLTRISRGKIELQRGLLDARDVARRACDDHRAAFEQRGVRLRFAEGAEPAWVHADAARLAQMLGNLLSNALKFTPAGGEVLVAVRLQPGACELTIRDTGAGIDPADLERIFESFVQADRTRERAQGGLGIGLSLVRELAALHGGSVRASSGGVGRGAEFAILLPRAPAPAPAPASGSGVRRAAPLTILLVEDHLDAGETLAELLSLKGHDVRLVTTGQAGVEAAVARPPDVLVCDLGLPDTSGHEVVRQIRARLGSGPFAIALTGFARPEDRRLALEAGFDAHLPKPPSLEELEVLLARAHRGRSGAPA